MFSGCITIMHLFLKMQPITLMYHIHTSIPKNGANRPPIPPLLPLPLPLPPPTPSVPFSLSLGFSLPPPPLPLPIELCTCTCSSHKGRKMVQ